MKWILRAGLLAGVIILISLAASYVARGDIYFFTDIARDFLLLEELAVKKFILIGPRSSTTGLFHGPLWLYLNYPAYALGGGNPVVVGWFWIFLVVVFLISGYWVARRLFNELTASVYVILLGAFIAPEARGFFNPYGAFLLMPLFFYSFVRYVQKKHALWASAVMLVAGLITQFQLAIGIPLAILSAAAILFFSIKHKAYLTIFAIFAYLVPTFTFILFDYRHDWIMTRSAYKYVFQDKLASEYTSVFSLFQDRLSLMTGGGLGVFRNLKDIYSRVAFILIAIMLVSELRHKKNRHIYLSAIYLYCGYHLFTAVNKTGGMLAQYYVPIFPMTFLVIASAVTTRWKLLFIPLVAYIMYVSVGDAVIFAKFSPYSIGVSEDSWKYNLQIARDLFRMPEQEFGYFIYSPDTFAYEQKYAVHYARKYSTKTVYESTKKPVTYVIVAPPPPGNTTMLDGWWQTNKLRIDQPPQTVKKYPSGARIDRYELSTEEIQTAPDPSVDLGIFFR